MKTRIDRLRDALIKAEDRLTELLEDPTASAKEIISAETNLDIAEQRYMDAVDPPGDWF
jgi:hypothetical protein